MASTFSNPDTCASLLHDHMVFGETSPQPYLTVRDDHKQFSGGDHWTIPTAPIAMPMANGGAGDPVSRESTALSFVNSASMPSLTLEYLNKLVQERTDMEETGLHIMVHHTMRLLNTEIERVRKDVFRLPEQTIADDLESDELPEPLGAIVTMQSKIYAPVQENPNFNFVGRILGPRGMTVKQLEERTGCKILVRGRGSNVRDRRQVGADERLHVVISVEDAENRAMLKIERARRWLEKLITPPPDGMDEFKKKQLIELAIINGTYRLPPRGRASVNTVASSMTGHFPALPASTEYPGALHVAVASSQVSIATPQQFWMMPSSMVSSQVKFTGCGSRSIAPFYDADAIASSTSTEWLQAGIASDHTRNKAGAAYELCYECGNGKTETCMHHNEDVTRI